MIGRISMRRIPYSSPRFLMNFVILTLCALLVTASTSSLVGVQEVHAQKVYNITLNPIADAYICRDDPYNNFGGRDKLEVYYCYPDTSRNKYSYLMFDLKSIPEDSIIESAKLQLYAYLHYYYLYYDYHYLHVHPTVRIGAHYCSDWNESTITWDDHPSFSTPATDIVGIEREGWYSWDVTSDTRLAFQTTGKKLTEVVTPEPIIGIRWASFYSRDQTDQLKLAYKPKLIINYTLAYYSVSVSTSGLPSTSSTNVYVDGVKVDTLSGGSSKTLKLDAKTSHSIKIDDYISGSTGVRYYSQSNSWAFSSTDSKEFSYTTQYYLTMKSEYGSPKGEGWYDAGSTATISINSPLPTKDWSGALGGKYVFDRWIGDLTSPDAVSTVTMDKPKTATATWRADYTMPTTILGLAIAIPIAGVTLFILMRKGMLIKGVKKSDK